MSKYLVTINETRTIEVDAPDEEAAIDFVTEDLVYDDIDYEITSVEEVGSELDPEED